MKYNVEIIEDNKNLGMEEGNTDTDTDTDTDMDELMNSMEKLKIHDYFLKTRSVNLSAEYIPFIKSVLKYTNPDINIIPNSLYVCADILVTICKCICNELDAYKNKNGVNIDAVIEIIKEFYPSNLRSHAIKEIETALLMDFPNNENCLDYIYVNMNKITVTKNLINSILLNEVPHDVAIGVHTVLTYLIKEILELAGNVVKDFRVKKITNRHITLAICSDEELTKLFSDMIIPYGGVIPHIDKKLLPSQDTAKRCEQDILEIDGYDEDPPHKKFRPGTVALQEIKKSQTETELYTSEEEIKDIIKEIMDNDFMNQYTFNADAIEALHIAAEDHLLQKLKTSNEHHLKKNLTMIETLNI